MNEPLTLIQLFIHHQENDNILQSHIHQHAGIQTWT